MSNFPGTDLRRGRFRRISTPNDVAFGIDMSDPDPANWKKFGWGWDQLPAEPTPAPTTPKTRSTPASDTV